jgi:glucokinase
VVETRTADHEVLKRFQVNEEVACYVPSVVRGGIDLGGTKIEAVVIDDGDRILGRARKPTPVSGDPAGIAAVMMDALRMAAEKARVQVDELAGVGVGSPGTVDATAGTVANARNLPNWEEPFPLAKTLASGLGVPAWLGNDVGVAAEAEAALGAGRPYRTFLGLWWGTGVGGAIMIDGRRWLGRGAAGEIGHTVVKLGGARCQCGRRGCLEAYAGRNAMERRARRAVKRGVKTNLFKIMERHGHDRLTSGVWQDALQHNDALAERLIARAIHTLGAGAASAINLTDLEAVVIGGGLGTRLGHPAAERVRQAMLPHLFVLDQPPDVRLCELGDVGGAIGAARLVSVS